MAVYSHLDVLLYIKTKGEQEKYYCSDLDLISVQSMHHSYPYVKLHKPRVIYSSLVCVLQEAAYLCGKIRKLGHPNKNWCCMMLKCLKLAQLVSESHIKAISNFKNQDFHLWCHSDLQPTAPLITNGKQTLCIPCLIRYPGYWNWLLCHHFLAILYATVHWNDIRDGANSFLLFLALGPGDEDSPIQPKLLQGINMTFIF